ncbi:acyl-CoA dehydrogenase [Acrocarpospora pleiomorpha]|uniref:Acyl-CoA dehydrogenase n=1 Tax=Acrocarpospora pleiomorpha TaxID=90975 RepID=A0A5M3XXA7_9ACTN|nr:acyl-CoA dehydrogenase family protein [Acrocarpospora pleiomorpha]GES25784.1 acyl-CoA dehydrogenase [Acrocarpospora pleiomorpha]
MSTIAPDPADLLALASAVDGVLAEKADGPIAFESPAEATRLAVWETAIELAWPLIGLPEELGGADGGVDELVVVIEQVGRWLAPGPFLGTALYAAVLAAQPDVAIPTIDEAVAAGVGFGLLGWGDGWPRPAHDGGQSLFFAPEGVRLGLLLARDRVELVTLEGGDRAGSALLDPAADMVIVDASSPRQTVLEGAAAEQLWLTSRLLLAAYAVGIADRTLRTTVDYAKTRHQFGQPIGSFQAVKHRCADMAIRELVARAALEFALDQVGAEAAVVASSIDDALAIALDAALGNAEACLETHGAMGFTWEFAGHRFLKRAHLLRALASSGHESAKR